MILLEAQCAWCLQMVEVGHQADTEAMLIYIKHERGNLAFGNAKSHQCPGSGEQVRNEPRMRATLTQAGPGLVVP